MENVHKSEERTFGFNHNDKNFYRGYLEEGYCVDADTRDKNLLPGQACSWDYQCQTMNCEDGTCRGGYGGDPCLKDTDCAPSYYCRDVEARGLTRHSCKPVRHTGEECWSDNQCMNHAICTR